MSDHAYVRQYFSTHAREWLARAYGDGGHPASYPVGAQRVRLALEAVLDRLGFAGGHLVDMGCGGGDLGLHAVRLGFEVSGIDIASGMIAEAEARRQALPPDVRDRLKFHVADALSSGLPPESADAVTALGLLEYVDEDGEFFRESARLLRPGGVLVVSCRNRLFNLTSLNSYTREEIEAGAGLKLLAELEEARPTRELRDVLREFVARLRAGVADLEEALEHDLREPAEPGTGVGGGDFARRRRQHRPSELAIAAAAAGFSHPQFLGVHPHLLPPAMEAIAPRFYNRLAATLEVFERLAASLRWSSAFLGVFTR